MRIWPAAVLVSVSVAAVILVAPLERGEIAKRLEAVRPGAGRIAQGPPLLVQRPVSQNEPATPGEPRTAAECRRAAGRRGRAHARDPG